MTQTTISRRAAIGGAAVAAIAVSCIPLPSHAGQRSSTKFQRLLTAFHERRAEERQFDREFLDPATKESERLINLLPEITASYDGLSGREAVLTTSDPAQVAMALRHVKQQRGVAWDRSDRFNLACRRVRAGARWRRLRSRAIRSRFNIDAIEDRSEALNLITFRAIDEAICCPCDSAADLLAKIELIEVEDWWDVDAARASVAADVRRLAGVA